MESQRLGLPFGGQHDNEYVLRGMMWADNFWLFCDNRERLIFIVNDIIEELMDLDMEPKPEPLWWTSTHKDEDMTTFRVGGHGSSFFAKSLKSWDTVIIGMGRDSKVANAPCARPWEAGGVASTSIAQRQFR